MRNASSADDAVDVVPAPVLAHEARALVQALGTAAAGAKARDEFHFGVVVVDAAVLLDFEAQPLRAGLQFQVAARTRRRVPCVEEPLRIAAFVRRITRA